MNNFLYLSIFPVLIFTLSAAVIPDAHAVAFTGSQTGPGEWTYNLTYHTRDNFSICPEVSQPSNPTTITLTNLAGVTSASGPTSTDLSTNHPGSLAWSATVSNGGTQVVWTHIGPGTGNPSTDKHVFGFKVLANANDGIVNVATDGFELDTGSGANRIACPTPDQDIVGTTSGPVILARPDIKPTIPLPNYCELFPQSSLCLPIPDPCKLDLQSPSCQNQNIKEFDQCISPTGQLICKVNLYIFKESVQCLNSVGGSCYLPNITEEILLEIKQQYPPLKQIKAGIDLKDIVPANGKVLIINDHRVTPISVTEETAKLFLNKNASGWRYFP